MEEEQASYRYSQDVNYTLVDKLKVAAQEAALKTRHNMEKWGFREITGSRGESCYLFKYTGKTPQIFGFVVEGLGTKNRAMDTFTAQLDFLCAVLDAQRTSSIQRYGVPGKHGGLYSTYANLRTGISPYFNAAVDTAMMIFLDMASSGVMPLVLGAHYAAGASDWFKKDEHIREYCRGMVRVCAEVDCTWGPGETPVLTNVVQSDTAVLDGAAVGILIADEPILGQNIKPDNLIWLVESTGLQANYLSGARRLAEKLPAGYLTPLSDGTPFGLALSMPTDVRYIKFIRRLIEEKVKLNYIVPITGHGLRKIMRARLPFSYRLSRLAPLSPLFRFMIEGLNLKGREGAEEAMGGMNLGQGLALITDNDEQTRFQVAEIGKEIFGQYGKAWCGGVVEDGLRQVIIENPDPIFEVDGQIVFTEESMEIRSLKQ